MTRHWLRISVVGMALLISAVAYEYLYAWTPMSACFVAPVGGANRSSSCTWGFTSCTQANPPCGGTCKMGVYQYACISCDVATEVEYHYCTSNPDTTCNLLGTATCLTYPCYYTSGFCTGDMCILPVDLGYNCSTGY